MLLEGELSMLMTTVKLKKLMAKDLKNGIKNIKLVEMQMDSTLERF